MSVRELARNGAAHRTLQILLDMGGKASVAKLQLAVFSHFRSTARFDSMVLVPLVSRKMVRVDGEQVTITSAGELWLSAAPRLGAGEVPAFRPLKPMGPGPIRDGALEYRQIPSLAGGKHIPYHAGARDTEGSE